MKSGKKKMHLKITGTFLLLLMLCLGFCFTSNAAVSVNNIKKVTGGTFIQKNGKWMYRYQNGKTAKDCLLEINGKTYYFSPNGYRQYGWKKIDNDYYYFGKASEGYMYKLCWVNYKNNTYFVKKSGKRATGWLYYHGKRYYLDKNGKRVWGWNTIEGKKYYFGTKDEGWRYTNTLLTYKNKVYYLGSRGTLTTGWKTVSGKRYYFTKNGYAYTGKHKINGVYYYFDSKGVLLYSGANLKISSDCAILINASTGEVLYEKNADTRHANASTTKIMTCILALEKTKLTDKVTASSNAASQEPTKLYLHAGEVFRMKDLLYSLMLPSHNDSAVAIAEHISGSTAKFASLMNQKAKSIGCKNTHFVTPNGLDNGLNHYTTARDLAKIAQYAYKNGTFRKIIGTSSYQFTSLSGYSYYLTTTNQLLNAMPGVKGMKTGFTNKAGYCFVGVVKSKSGTNYISVTLGAPTSTARWDDSKKLLEYAYNLK